jgi:hypothetical protein
MSTIPIGRSVPDEYAPDLSHRQIYFVEHAVGPDVRPTLPNGGLGVSDRDAVIATAEKFMGDIGPGMQVTARYGLYSSPYPAAVTNGVSTPFYQDHPMWIVTYFGPGVNAPASLRFAGAGVVHHINMLVDAESGQLLSVFN